MNIDSKTIEKLLKTISAPCRIELETAMESSEGELSEVCIAEIQQFVSLSNEPITQSSSNKLKPHAEHCLL